MSMYSHSRKDLMSDNNIILPKVTRNLVAHDVNSGEIRTYISLFLLSDLSESHSSADNSAYDKIKMHIAAEKLKAINDGIGDAIANTAPAKRPQVYPFKITAAEIADLEKTEIPAMATIIRNIRSFLTDSISSKNAFSELIFSLKRDVRADSALSINRSVYWQSDIKLTITAIPTPTQNRMGNLNFSDSNEKLYLKFSLFTLTLRSLI